MDASGKEKNTPFLQQRPQVFQLQASDLFRIWPLVHRQELLHTTLEYAPFDELGRAAAIHELLQRFPLDIAAAFPEEALPWEDSFPP
jgi:hypothetical protein